MKYYYQGNVKEAIKYLKIAIEMEPNNERLQNNLKLMNGKSKKEHLNEMFFTKIILYVFLSK